MTSAMIRRTICAWQKWRDRRIAARTRQRLLRASPELCRYEDAIQDAKRLHRPTRRLYEAKRQAVTEMLRGGR